jgi:hypothetical protein
MSKFLDAMRYETHGRVYYVFPNGTKTIHGWRVLFADLYTKGGDRIGSWDRAEMPLAVIRMLEKHLKYLELFGDDEPEDTTNSL